jgi:hypothetical protein
MEQLKWRVDAVQKTMHLAKARRHYLPDGLAFEFCLLQLRYCCENIALGLVAIHTDVSKGKLRQQGWLRLLRQISFWDKWVWVGGW